MKAYDVIAHRTTKHSGAHATQGGLNATAVPTRGGERMSQALKKQGIDQIANFFYNITDWYVETYLRGGHIASQHAARLFL